MKSFEIDRQRDNQAQLAGWRILRFTWQTITEHPDEVAEHDRIAFDVERRPLSHDVKLRRFDTVSGPQNLRLPVHDPYWTTSSSFGSSWP